MTFRNTILPAPGQPAKDAISKPMNKRSSLYVFPKEEKYVLSDLPTLPSKSLRKAMPISNKSRRAQSSNTPPE